MPHSDTSHTCACGGSCGCQDSHETQQGYLTREEYIERLEIYLKDLKAEIVAVEQELSQLRTPVAAIKA